MAPLWAPNGSPRPPRSVTAKVRVVPAAEKRRGAADHFRGDRHGGGARELEVARAREDDAAVHNMVGNERVQRTRSRQA